MHKSVLADEAIEALNIKNQSLYIDATLGAGGHTKKIIEKGGIVLGIDADKKMLEIAKKNVDLSNGSKLVQGNYRDIDILAINHGFTNADGILYDFGISSYHLDTFKRGFSFKDPSAPLDMRLDTDTQMVTAADLVNSLRSDQLVDLFEIGYFPQLAKKLSKRIVEQRRKKRIENVGDFLEIVDKSLPNKVGVYKGTQAFMSLRIAVNTEYDSIKISFPKAVNLLASGGRLVVISFHSGEDKIVKHLAIKAEKEKLIKIVTKNPVVPTEKEIDENPRSRSAKLRIFEKL